MVRTLWTAGGRAIRAARGIRLRETTDAATARPRAQLAAIEAAPAMSTTDGTRSSGARRGRNEDRASVIATVDVRGIPG